VRTSLELAAADKVSLAANQKLRFFPLIAVEGRGTVIVDADGRELLDFSSGFTAAGLGYGHPSVVAAVSAAIARQPFSGGISAMCPDSIDLARALIAMTPEIKDARVYLGNSGTDANDMALRSCLAFSGRRRIIAFERGYHGGLGLALGVSGVHVEAGATPYDHVTFLPFPDPVRPHVGDAGDAVRDVIERLQHELSNDSVACVIVEPIQSDGGQVSPVPGFLQALRDVTRQGGVPLILDEVKVGLGRTGSFYAFRHEGIEPDIVTLGKCLGGGLPLSAAVGPAAIFDSAPGSSLLTTSGNPVCAAAGLAVLREVVERNLDVRAGQAGEVLQQALVEAVASHEIADVVGDVRGRGLTVGIDLVKNRSSMEGDLSLARKAVYRAWQLGVVVIYVGGHVIEVTPPLTASDEELTLGAHRLAQAIHDARDGLVEDDEVAAYAGW